MKKIIRELGAKEMIIEFVNTVFLIFLIYFSLFYYILGDALGEFNRILKLIAPLALFASPLVYIFRERRPQYKKFKKENTLNEVINYITRNDIILDRVIIITLPLIILGISIYDLHLQATDLIQAFVVFLIMLGRHLMFFFKRENIERIIQVTNFDKMKDEIIIFSLPLLVMSVGSALRSINKTDYFQAVTVFVVMYAWHKYLFKE